MSFDDFVNILKEYLDANFDFGDQLTLKDYEDSLLEISAIFQEYTQGQDDKHRVPIEQFSDLSLFLLKKLSARKFVRFTRLKSFEFFELLEKALERETVQFRQYMLYIKKNLGYVLAEDTVKILRRFQVFSLPGGSDLLLNPPARRHLNSSRCREFG